MRTLTVAVLTGVLLSGGWARPAGPGTAPAPVATPSAGPGAGLGAAAPPKGATPARVSSFLHDRQQVGVAMPLILRFQYAVPLAFRAAVVKRIAVRSVPAQPGAWRWITPTEVHYRPAAFWKPGTRISYDVKLGGVPLAPLRYGRADLHIEDVTVTRSFVMKVDARTKQMIVRRDGRVVMTIPVSLGKPSTPTSSGTMVVMEKKEHTVFDTLDELGPVDGYRLKIDYAQRLTWGGEFLHAAPWSEGVQGKSNVSHGCVNVSEKMGAWLFAHTMIGDPLTVTGTPRKLRAGNGWTDWNQPWSQWAAA